jgi:hypothetical protein
LVVMICTDQFEQGSSPVHLRLFCRAQTKTEKREQDQLPVRLSRSRRRAHSPCGRQLRPATEGADRKQRHVGDAKKPDRQHRRGGGVGRGFLGKPPAAGRTERETELRRGLTAANQPSSTQEVSIADQTHQSSRMKSKDVYLPASFSQPLSLFPFGGELLVWLVVSRPAPV